MNEISLVKLSLAVSFFGLFLLFIFSLFAEAEETAIADLGVAEEKDVMIKGRVTAIKDFDNLAVVEVAEIKSATVVVFDRQMLNFMVGDNVAVTGEVKDYKGKKEIVAGSVKKFS